MTPLIVQDTTRCAKCGGSLAAEQIGLEIDLFCRNCGSRQVAVVQHKVYSSAIVEKVTEKLPVSWDTKDGKVCAHCGASFEGIQRHIYCSNVCRSAASKLRLREWR